jgi:hypothetical protein
LMLLRPGPALIFCIYTQNVRFQHVVCSRSDLTSEAQQRLKCSAVAPQCPRRDWPGYSASRQKILFGNKEGDWEAGETASNL